MFLAWEEIGKLEDVNSQWLLWKDMFLSVVDKHAPFIRRRIRNKLSPWLTSEIKQSLTHRDQLKRQAIKTKLYWMTAKSIKILETAATIRSRKLR